MSTARIPDGTPLPIDQDDEATWPQLRARLQEIREWAADLADEDWNALQVLKILNRPREVG